jgi:hypothetical protein
MNADNVQVQGKQKGPSAFSDSKPISKSSLLSVPSVLSAVQLVLLFIARYQECNRDRHSGAASMGLSPGWHFRAKASTDRHHDEMA